MQYRGVVILVYALWLPHVFAAPKQLCPAGIGASEGTPPLRVVRLANTAKLLVCGPRGERRNGVEYFSEIEVISVHDRRIVLQFSALDSVSLVVDGNTARFTHHLNVPSLPSMRWRLVRSKTHILHSTSPTTVVAKEERHPYRPALTKADVIRIIGMYQRARQTGIVEEGLPTLLVLAEAAGHAEVARLNKSVVSDLKLDGALALEYVRARDAFLSIKD